MAMRDSSEDMIRLVGQIGLRIPIIFPKMLRRHLAIPPAMAKRIAHATEIFDRVRIRFESGDFRHDSKELKAIGELGQFLISMHTEMANQDRLAKGMVPVPIPQLTIEEARMVKRKVSYG